jgi:hypothetical protein
MHNYNLQTDRHISILHQSLFTQRARNTGAQWCVVFCFSDETLSRDPLIPDIFHFRSILYAWDPFKFARGSTPLQRGSTSTADSLNPIEIFKGLHPNLQGVSSKSTKCAFPVLLGLGLVEMLRLVGVVHETRDQGVTGWTAGKGRVKNDLELWYVISFNIISDTTKQRPTQSLFNLVRTHSSESHTHPPAASSTSYDLEARASESLKNCKKDGDWPRTVYNPNRLLQNKWLVAAKNGSGPSEPIPPSAGDSETAKHLE